MKSKKSGMKDSIIFGELHILLSETYSDESFEFAMVWNISQTADLKFKYKI